MPNIEYGPFPTAAPGYQESRNLGGGAEWAPTGPPPPDEGGGDIYPEPVLGPLVPIVPPTVTAYQPPPNPVEGPEADLFGSIFSGVDFAATMGTGLGIARFMGHSIELTEGEANELRALLARFVARNLVEESMRILTAVQPVREAVGTHLESVQDLSGQEADVAGGPPSEER